MSETNEVNMDEIHRKLAVELFNAAWDLMDKESRTTAENDTLIHTTHASRYHWAQVGEPVNLARGEWQVSRVYTVLTRFEPATYHAQRCLDICLENGIADWDIAFAYEALARAWSLSDDTGERDRFLAQAIEACQNVADEEDRQIVLNDLKTIPGYADLAPRS
jgi:hypothetical protein